MSPGSNIGEHTLTRLVTTGATSEVFEARHRESGRLAAVKVPFAGGCLDEELVARFLNEARVLERLAHPHIVAVRDRGVLPDGRPFLLLEWLPSDLHRALVRAGGAFPVGTAARIAGQIADALLALHKAGIVHRDVKPANVLLSDDDPLLADVKLTDLGLAKLPAGGASSGEPLAPLAALHVSTGQSAVFGTWEYMAPEQWIQSKTVGPAADVYSLGVLLFQMLTGVLPFVAGQQTDWMYYHVMEPPPLGLLEKPAPALRDLVGRMLSKKAPTRPTMREIASLLQSA